jgi:serine protease AprX
MGASAAPGTGTALAVIVDGTSTIASAAAVQAVGGVILAPLDIIGGVAATVPGRALAELRAAGYEVTADRTVEPLAAQFGDGSDGGGVNAQVTALHPGSVGGPGAGAGTTVGLIDTGVTPHPDLAGRLHPGVDLSGTSDDARTDPYGHGTFMAGLIAGARTGVAPGADIVPIKVAGADGTTTLRTLIQAIGWAVVHQDDAGVGIDVLNLSFGTVAPMAAPGDPLAQAVEAAWDSGLTVVVASGNEGAGTVTSPGTSASALTIGATDHRGTAATGDDVVATWSGSETRASKPELVVPGTSLISLRAPGSTVDRANADNQIPVAFGPGYFIGSGTSMATALATGAAAVVLAAHPEASPGDVKGALVDTAVALTGGGATIDLERATTLQATDATAQPGAPGRGLPHRGTYADGAVGWDGARWTGARWTGARWTGARWTGARWTEASWAGARWTGARWTGARWTDDEWAGARWTGARWTGARWTGARWTGARWTGARWTMTPGDAASQR